jgi:coenzyme F420-reducing hydrogenase beta subunit
MILNIYGEYNPKLLFNCVSRCGLCLKVCPFGEETQDEDKIAKSLYGEHPSVQHRLETGYYLDCYVGYSNVNNHRKFGASGGLATWILEELINDKIVDAVICIMHDHNSDKLFRFTIITTVENLRKCSGSVYYPVELSEVIKYILNNPGKYAVIGLPCFIKAIRLSQQRNKILQDRIHIVLGLTCGQMKSSHYTSYLSWLAGLNENPVQVKFRGKEQGKSANNFYFSAIDNLGKEYRIFWIDGVDEVYLNRWFTPNACNYCDDIFAETADIVFMDAWLPEYLDDYKGMSIILIRSVEINKLIKQKCNSSALHIQSISINNVIKSQQGVITIKRRYLAHRLYEMKKKLGKNLKKRVKPVKERDPFLRYEIFFKEKMRLKSKELWIQNNVSNNYFKAVMQQDVNKLALNGKLLFPLRMIRYFFKFIYRFNYE